MLSPTPKFSKSKSLLDTMATQTRSNLSIPDPPVISLPGRSKKTTPKPALTTAPVSVPVETVSSEGSTDALALVGDSGEKVPASLKVAQIDITKVTDNDPKSSVDNKDTKFSFASSFASRPTTSSSAAPFGMKPAPNNDDDDDDDDVDDDDDGDDVDDDDITPSGK